MRLLDTPETGDTSARGGRQARAQTSGGGTTSATCVATWSSPTGIWRGSDDPDSQKWVPNVGSRCCVARNVSSIHAADPHLTCRRSLVCVWRLSSSRASLTSADGQTVGPLQPLLSPGHAAPDTMISYTRTDRNRTLQQLCLFENGVCGHLGAPTSIVVSPSTTRRCLWTAQGACAAQDASQRRGT